MPRTMHNGLCYTCDTLARGAKPTSANRRNILSGSKTANEPDRLLPFPIKRGFDLVLLLVLSPLALLLSLVIALAVLIDSGRPVLFVQARVGQYKKRFWFYKFRTLRHDYDDSLTRQTLQAFVRGEVALDAGDGQPRIHKPIPRNAITRVGRVLRNTGLDELPQLLNSLRGEMSWVGPRPHVESEVECYAEWHHKRFAALPGITGLTQVRAARLRTFDEMVLCDLEYIERAGLLLDLKILFWTIGWVFFGCAAR